MSYILIRLQTPSIGIVSIAYALPVRYATLPQSINRKGCSAVSCFKAKWGNRNWGVCIPCKLFYYSHEWRSLSLNVVYILEVTLGNTRRLDFSNRSKLVLYASMTCKCSIRLFIKKNHRNPFCRSWQSWIIVDHHDTTCIHV